MRTSFSTALAGLSAHSAGIDAVGNNLANLNTTGFKGSSVQFRDLVSQSGAIGNEQGFGTAPPHFARYFTQGPIQSSTGAMDAAIKGDGFFVAKGNQGTVYTRAGNFQVDGNGYLVTTTGERIQGWAEANGALNTATAITDITLPVGALQKPIATTKFSFDLNLNAMAAAGDEFTTPIEVYDSLGKSHVLTATFTRTANANEWDYEITIPGADVGSANATETIATSSSPITFDGQGKLTAPAANQTGIQVTGLTNGADDLDLTWEFYSSTTTPRMTQFSHPSAVSANAQDGGGASQLTRIGMADGGRIVAQFSNGQQRVVAQLALAAIRNPESLQAIGNNLLQIGADTALPAIGLADTGGRGDVVGGALESSNIDIAREFTNLIVLQRGYQANSRVITTADEMSQETINLKR
ncbi:MAG: flagellar hook protein FlgE [Bryobacteraceae bacterium]